MMKKPVLSYVLAIYNAEETIRECLDSIFSQTLSKEDYEVLILDGGSIDKTPEILAFYKNKYPQNIRLIPNTRKFSEGAGMGKDKGISLSHGKFVALIDHDNILLESSWAETMLGAFNDKKIMAVQSLLSSKKAQGSFLKYINDIGVEDPYAIPQSLVAQVSLFPQRFHLEKKGNYFSYLPDKRNVLFFGANGCIFRREVFDKIGGYTRDVDISAKMAQRAMIVAIPLKAHIYHKTASNIFKFLFKKGKYFRRFISEQYKEKDYVWVERTHAGRIKFCLKVCYNLTLLGPLFYSIYQVIHRKSLYWLIHAPLLLAITFEYLVLSMIYIKNLVKYLR